MFVMKPINIKKVPNAARVRGALVAALVNTKREMEQDFAKIIATWQHKPRFASYIGYGGGTAYIRIFTLDRAFNYLDRGTIVRYATMAPGFVPKTKPNWIGSQAGSQGLWFVSRKKPHAGIHARHFSLEIRRKHEAKFKKRIRDAVHIGLS